MSVYRTENDVMKKAADIDRIFDYLVLCDDVENVKPHPEIYHKTREKMGLEKHEILVFEDSLHGVRAAKDAGLTVVNVVDKHSSEDQDEINELADYRADNWGELNAIL